MWNMNFCKGPNILLSFGVFFMSALFLFVWQAPVGAALFYVSPEGNNSNSGTEESPWQTPSYGVGKLQPGDTLVIKGGYYVLEDMDDIIKPSSGTSDAWITIKGDPTNRPVLAGRDNLLTVVDMSGVQYVRMENLEITHDSQDGEDHWCRDGIEILGGQASHIVLQNVYIHHLDEFGINAKDVDDFQILNCRIEFCGFGAIGGPAGERGGWRNVVIRGSTLSWSGHYYRGGDGSNRPYDRPDGFGIEPSQGPILIEYTSAQHNYGDGLDSKAANTTIRNCIVANNSCDGVKLWAGGSIIENTVIFGRGDGNTQATPWAPIVIDQVEQPNAHFEIVNVTVDDYVGQNYLMYVQYGNPVPVEVVVRNSIFSGRGPRCPIYIHPSSKLVADHNIFYMPQNNIVLTRETVDYSCDGIGSIGKGNKCADPKFIDVESGDLHLSDSSPCIDAGNNNALTESVITDLDGRPRFFDMPSVADKGVGSPPIVDIGAYEVQMEPRVTVNDSDGPVELDQSDTLTIKVSLNNKGATCGADWWLAASTPSGFYFFTTEGWTDEYRPFYQGALANLDEYEVFTSAVAGLVPGFYTVYFCVDTKMDGEITWESLNYDAILMNIK